VTGNCYCYQAVVEDLFHNAQRPGLVESDYWVKSHRIGSCHRSNILTQFHLCCLVSPHMYDVRNSIGNNTASTSTSTSTRTTNQNSKPITTHSAKTRLTACILAETVCNAFTLSHVMLRQYISRKLCCNLQPFKRTRKPSFEVTLTSLVQRTPETTRNMSRCSTYPWPKGTFYQL